MMDQKDAHWLWNALCAETIDNDNENKTKFGVMAISHGLSTYLYPAKAEDNSNAAGFLRQWADKIEGK
jgi:hypothetical protein